MPLVETAGNGSDNPACPRCGRVDRMIDPRRDGRVRGWWCLRCSAYHDPRLEVRKQRPSDLAGEEGSRHPPTKGGPMS